MVDASIFTGTGNFTGGNGYSKSAGAAPHKLMTVSGPPPLTIRRALPRPPERIVICGNTADGMGVGDRTLNLFSSASVLLRGRITDNSSAKVTFITGNRSYGVTFFKGTLSPNTAYTIKLNNTFTGTIGNTYGIRVQVNGTWLDGFKKDICSFTTDSTGKAEIDFYVGTPYPDEDEVLTLTDIMLVEGSYSSASMPAYEPYGMYKLPVIFTSAQSENRQKTLYLPAPIYSGEHQILTDLGDIRLFKGTNTVSVNTAIPPETVSVCYLC